MRLTPALACAAALIVSSCGSPEHSSEGRAEPTQQSTTAPAVTRVSCDRGGHGWPTTVMPDGIESKIPRAEINAAFRSLYKDMTIDAPEAFQGGHVDDAPWVVLAETRTTAEVAVGTWTAEGPGEDGEIVELEKDGGKWDASGWGGCSLTPVLPRGQQWVELSAGTDLDRSSKDLSLGVVEIACNSGRDPRPFLNEPTVVETDKSVTVSWTSKDNLAASTCLGVSPFPKTVRLSRPLGDRTLYDGSTWPATRIKVS